jgi:two-component system, LuxR family, sensor kinase FixL
LNLPSLSLAGRVDVLAAQQCYDARERGGEVAFDKVQIQQVLLNLARNAAEAMAKSPCRELSVTTSTIGEERVEIAVADTGPELAVEVREKLFQPFVTTKSSGMGVGLSICHAIIEAHGGRMWATDNPRGGTVFRFTVPMARAAEGRDKPNAAVALGALPG